MDRRGDRTAEGIGGQQRGQVDSRVDKRAAEGTGGQQRRQEDCTLQECIQSSDIKDHKHFVGYVMNVMVAERIKETN